MKSMKMLVFPFVMATTFVAGAKVVSWHRFEEHPSGTKTDGGMIFTNSVDSAKYPAYARVCTANGNNKFNPSSPTVLTADHERMPACTDGFPSDVSLYDKTGEEYRNNTSIDLRNPAADKNNPSGLLLIDDHEDLRLKSFTLEFFMRSEATETFRTLAVRTSSQYPAKEAFRISARTLTNGGMYILGEIRTLAVTNASTMAEEIVCWNFSANNTAATVNDDLWHHIALTVDNDAKKACMYIDYVLRASVEFKGEIFYDEGYPFSFGGDPQCSYYNMSMAVDEIRLSDEALAPDGFLKYGYWRDAAVTENVDDDTLFFFDFDDSIEPVAVGEGDMKIVCTNIPFLVNKARNPRYARTNAELLSFHTGTNVYSNLFYPARNESQLPNAGVRFGLTGTGLIENTASCHILTNSPLNDNLYRIVLPESVTREDLFGDSLTVEGFFMVPGKADQYGFDSKLSSSFPLFCMNGAFVIQMGANPAAWSYGYITEASIGGNKLNSTFTDHPTFTKKSYADGVWHHFALVYDREAQEGFLYLDGKLELQGSVPSPYSNVNNWYVKGFLMGTAYWEDIYSTNFRFDDIRISRGALRPYQFMTTVPEEMSVHYASASFENNFVMHPYTNFFGEAGNPVAFTEAGSVPVCERTCPARVLTAGKDGAAITEKNRFSVRIDGGAVVYPERALVADLDEFTVQFFMKMKDVDSGAGIVRVNRGSATLVTNTVTWALSFADEAGNLALKVDTDAAENQTHNFSAAILPGTWHHIGIQFRVEGANSVVSLYRDYELADSWTLEGKIITRPRLVNLMFGAGEDSSAAFDGWIDEFRITPGVVEPADFMYADIMGLIFLVR